MEFWQAVIVPALQGVMQDILGVLPKLLAALVILLIGWLVAKLLENLVSRLLKRIGFNSLAERAGIEGFMRNAGFKQEVSWLVGRLVFWMLVLVFVLSAAETLQMDTLALSIQKVVGFIPNLILVIFILVFGAVLARLAGRLVRATAMDAEIDFAEFLGKLVHHVVLIVIIVLAVSQLELDSSVIDTSFAAIIGAVALAVALTLGLGSRQISYNIICGVYARKTYQIGQAVRFADAEGEILQIGTINTVLKNHDGMVCIPNRALIDNTTLMPGKTAPTVK